MKDQRCGRLNTFSWTSVSALLRLGSKPAWGAGAGGSNPLAPTIINDLHTSDSACGKEIANWLRNSIVAIAIHDRPRLTQRVPDRRGRPVGTGQADHPRAVHQD